MRRVSLPWVLSLLLVFAQQGALLHGLGHLSHGASHAGAELTDLQGDERGSCASCDAFAQVANPAGGTAAALSACPLRLLPSVGACHAFAGAYALTPRSRGPPQA